LSQIFSTVERAGLELDEWDVAERAVLAVAVEPADVFDDGELPTDERDAVDAGLRQVDFLTADRRSRPSDRDRR